MTDTILTRLTPAKFLEHARPIPGKNAFVVGTFERGITLYRQQVRALNLVHAMVEAKDSCGAPVIAPHSSVAIIGGGAFGVTAAAAAAYVGFDTLMFEKHQILLPMQRGCDTRWVHPRYYDWPAPGSDSRFARLPILDWQAGTAGQVADQIEVQFWEIVEQKSDNLRCIVDVADLEIHANDSGVDKFEVEYRKQSGEQDVVPVDVVILAVGFGVENSASNSPYWRNDRLNQVELGLGPGQKSKYIVSGTGDSGLTDVFRLTIGYFRHEQIFTDLFGDANEGLIGKLRELQRTAPVNHRTWLFDQFRKLVGDNPAQGPLSLVVSRLKARRRSDTLVVLNGTSQNLRSCLNLRRVSLSNALLCYLLFRIGAMQYKGGKLNVDDPTKLQLDRDGRRPDWLNGQLIIRHGTRRDEPLVELGFSDAIPELRSRAKEPVETGSPIFPAGWWSRYTRHKGGVPDKKGQLPAPVEFVPPATITHATTFISTLADILRDLSDRAASGSESDPEFRMTLHRLVQFDDRDYFQQITPYAGRIAKTEGLGRIFSAKGGIVGLTCQTGSLVVATNRDSEKFQEIWRLTQLGDIHARPIKPYVNAILACPFFAPPNANVPGDHVSLVIFADSAQADFFSDEVLRIISAACNGFVKNLEWLREAGALVPVSSDYPCFRVCEPAKIADLVKRLKKLGVEFDNAQFKTYKKDLTFKTLQSLDLEVGNPTGSVQKLS